MLRAGLDEYAINDAALAYMREHKLPKATIALFASARQRFAGQRSLHGASAKARPYRPYRSVQTPSGSQRKPHSGDAIAEQGLLDGTVIVSDGAGQFRIAEHALCWVHAERLIHKLDTFCEAHLQAKEAIRTVSVL